jgi:hypothetical protein
VIVHGDMPSGNDRTSHAITYGECLRLIFLSTSSDFVSSDDCPDAVTGYFLLKTGVQQVKQCVEKYSFVAQIMSEKARNPRFLSVRAGKGHEIFSVNK